MQTDYIRKLPLYERSGVREYWIINPDSRTVRTYLFTAEDDDTYTREYVFDDFIPVRICDGFSIRISDLL
jgi:Uma2 family endonuclease